MVAPLFSRRIPRLCAPGIAAFAALMFGSSPAPAQDADTATVEQTFDLDRYNAHKAREVRSLTELAEDFQNQQALWLPIAPPSTEFWGWTQDADVTPLPFDPAQFPESFVAGLVPASLNGVVIYPVTAWEDPSASRYVFYNADGKEIGSVPTPKGYDPRWCLFGMYPDLESRGWSTEYTETLALIYEPSHLLIRYSLVLDDDLVKWVLNESAEAAMRAAAASFDPNKGGGIMLRTAAAESNIVIEAITRETNGVMLQIGYPDDFTNHLEVFTCTNLVPFWWTLTATNLSTAGTNTIYWTDTDTNFAVRFFAIGNADSNTTTDPDGDGLTWAREKYLYHTCPTNSDTDGDGLSDYQEVIVLNTDPNNSDTNKPAVQINFPANNYHWVWMP